MINEIGSKKYQTNKLDNNFGTEGVVKHSHYKWQMKDERIAFDFVHRPLYEWLDF
jgi:hypothetical protein